jgi:hypothetical protein
MKNATPTQWIEQAETRRVLSRALFEHPTAGNDAALSWWPRSPLPAVLRLAARTSHSKDLTADRPTQLCHWDARCLEPRAQESERARQLHDGGEIALLDATDDDQRFRVVR